MAREIDNHRDRIGRSADLAKAKVRLLPKQRERHGHDETKKLGRKDTSASEEICCDINNYLSIHPVSLHLGDHDLQRSCGPERETHTLRASIPNCLATMANPNNKKNFEVAIIGGGE